MSKGSVADESLQQARDAFERHAWREAFDLFSAADSAGKLAPEDLEGLAQAAWCTGRIDECIQAGERAFAAYVEAGNGARAAFVALRLSSLHRVTLALSVAMGWFNRAQRLLADEPECPAHGYLASNLAYASFLQGNLDSMLDCAKRAFEIGSRFGERNLQAYGLHWQGIGLVLKGQIAEGMALLDEHMVDVVAGELDPFVTSVIFCGTIETCHMLADYRRAAEWAEEEGRALERQLNPVLPADCRVHRAEILRLRGAWAEAEQEAKRACDEAIYYHRHVGSPFHEIGEIKLRMGDLAAAEDAFFQAHERGYEPQPGLALLRLAQGKVDAAAAMINNSLAQQSRDRLARARLLPAQVQIAVAASDLETAASGADELEAIAKTYGTPALGANAACARGELQLAQGDAAACESLRRGCRLWQEVEAPYEAARARTLLAAACRAEGDNEAAVLELRAAKSTFDRLSAIPDARRATELLGPDAPVQTVVRRSAKTLMFTDICKSTNLVDAMGDEAWENILGWHDRTLRTLFADHGGEEIKHAGDGFFVAFPEAASAIGCAVAIQRTLAEHRRSQGFAPEIRIGVHSTEATVRGRDYGGKGVHTAARIGAVAEAGEILVSQESMAEPLSFSTSDPRAVRLKGISQPVEVVSIEWRW